MTNSISTKGITVILLVAFISSLLLPASSSSASGSDIDLDIKTVIDGIIISIEHPYYVDLYESMPIRIVFKNIGSVEYQERITFDIVNWSLDTLATFYDGYFTLKPGEERAYNTSYIPTVSGYQWIHVKVSFLDEEVEGWSSFYVYPKTKASEVSEPSLGEGVVGPSEPEIGIPVMKLNYTERVDVSKGQSYLIYLMVENMGARFGNVSLDNIIFFAKSIGIPFSVVPDRIHKLEPNGTGFFLITLNVPAKIDAGEYALDFTVMSDETQKKGKIYITVKELPIKEEIWRTIQNYLFIIERLKLEIRQASSEGANVSIAERYLNESIINVNDAIDFYNIEDYDGAKKRLVTARGNLERCVLELALARADLFRITLPAYVTILLIVLVIIAVTTALFFIYVRRRKKKRETKQKQRAS